ncbi:MAG: protein kinase [Planctomycetota bacterium]|nr:protein kinase [Planctomycetota bacterium]
MTKDSGNVDKGLSFFKRAEESTRTTGTGKAPGICKAGQNIDEYKLVKCLGRGGMGEVWEAVQKSLKRTVALKVLLPGGGIREFAREARAGARLNHSGIVAVYDTGEADGIPWIAMELVEGAYTLGDFIKEMRGETELPEDYYTNWSRI